MRLDPGCRWSCYVWTPWRLVAVTVAFGCRRFLSAADAPRRPVLGHRAWGARKGGEAAEKAARAVAESAKRSHRACVEEPRVELLGAVVGEVFETHAMQWAPL